MDAKSRIRTLRLLDRMRAHPELAEALGLTDWSTFRGKPIPRTDTKPPQENTDAIRSRKTQRGGL